MPTASLKGKPPMSDKIIKNGRVVTDDRLTVSLAEGEAATDIAVPAGPVLVPLAVWQARRDELLARARSGELGVWLPAGEDVAARRRPRAAAGHRPALPQVSPIWPQLFRRHPAAHPLRLPGRAARDRPGAARPVQLRRAAASTPCSRRPSATPTNSSRPPSPASTTSPSPTSARCRIRCRCSAVWSVATTARCSNERKVSILRPAAANLGHPSAAHRRAARHGRRQGCRGPAARGG